MRGIILAGGSGTRLHPITHGISKQLVPVYDKPMIYYPLSTLMLAGIRDILVITTPHDAEQFQRLLGDGSQFGINLSYAAAGRARRAGAGLHPRRGLHRRRDRRPGAGRQHLLRPGARAPSCAGIEDIDGGAVFAYRVDEPHGLRRRGVRRRRPGASRSRRSRSSRKSNYAVPGLYFYDNDVVGIAKRPEALAPAASWRSPTSTGPTSRGASSASKSCPAARPGWTPEPSIDLNDASNFIRTIENRQGLKIGAPEEIAWRQGFLSDDELRQRAEPLVKSGYGAYLLELLEP